VLVPSCPCYLLDPTTSCRPQRLAARGCRAGRHTLAGGCLQQRGIPCRGRVCACDPAARALPALQQQPFYPGLPAGEEDAPGHLAEHDPGSLLSCRGNPGAPLELLNFGRSGTKSTKAHLNEKTHLNQETGAVLISSVLLVHPTASPGFLNLFLFLSKNESLSSLRKSRLQYIQRCEELEKAKNLSAKAEDEYQSVATTNPGSASKQLEKRRRSCEEAQAKVMSSEEAAGVRSRPVRHVTASSHPSQ